MKKIILKRGLLLLMALLAVLAMTAAPALATPATTVTSISPNSGSSGGGTPVTITGTNFVSGATVSFGVTAATNVVIGSGTSITCTSPVGTGPVDVTVTTPSGTSAIGSADQFTYVAAPTVTGVSPNPSTGAYQKYVTITGTGFTKFAPTVNFISTTDSANNVTDTYTNLRSYSDTQIIALAPYYVNYPDTWDVIVTSNNGTSAINPNDSLTLYSPMYINQGSYPPKLPAAKVGTPYNYAPTPYSYYWVSGGSGSCTWSATGLPAGLTINSSTGAIAGTPTTATGSPFIVKLTVTDTVSYAGNTASNTYSLTVSQPTMTVTQTPTITTTPIYGGVTTSVSGTAVANASIVLSINGTAQPAVTANGGNWTVSGLTLTSGDTISVTAQAPDEAISQPATANVTSGGGVSGGGTGGTESFPLLSAPPSYFECY
jgi:hypothetical protein